ncbi:MAG: hypothetical protein ACYC1Q_09740 [Bacteroidia bacterium]
MSDEIIWTIITRDLPKLKIQLSKYINH